MPMLPKGSKIGVDDGAGGYDDILGVHGFSLDAGTADTVDVTDWDSPDDYEETLGGIKRGGSITLQTNSSPEATGSPASNYDKIPTLHASQEVKEWRWAIGSGPAATATFNAHVTNYTISADPGEKIVTSVTLKISGAITWS